MGKKHNRTTSQWCTIDLHIHTPASSDYQQATVSYLDILKRAELRGLDVISFTDHNTVAGYRSLKEEIRQLELLEKLNRLLPDERSRLNEYRRLLEKILLLPGFEFTATFGFHILALFEPDKSTREIEHLLLNLRIPAEHLDEGSATVGATTDVITAYRLIKEAGGLVIAAHANSSNGVAMRGFPLGGQTKIAYTQDEYLHALEVTDLEMKGKRSTAAFFNGTKPEYPRRMHCIQGSDSHRLAADPQRKKNLGVGDRATDVLISEISFEALLDLFNSNDFARTRPHRLKEEPVFDFIHAAQEEGANIVQDFHESMSVRGGKRYSIIANVCAFANTNGGTLYIGLNPDPKKPAPGVLDLDASITLLEKEINHRITPPLQCQIDGHETNGKKIMRVLVPRGSDPPYALDDNKIYIRSEAETNLAVRDEIVGLVLRGGQQSEEVKERAEPSLPEVGEKIPEKAEAVEDFAPRTGVEVVSMDERSGTRSYTMRDLRNGNVVKNVTRTSARRLWHYAITQFSGLPVDLSQLGINWLGNYGLLRSHKQGSTLRYDLVQKTSQGNRYYFGVTEDGIHGPWKQVVGEEDD
jgi:PHP family Zn ribbon phosphoesterase